MICMMILKGTYLSRLYRLCIYIYMNTQFIMQVQMHVLPQSFEPLKVFSSVVKSRISSCPTDLFGGPSIVRPSFR